MQQHERGQRYRLVSIHMPWSGCCLSHPHLSSPHVMLVWHSPPVQSPSGQHGVSAMLGIAPVSGKQVTHFCVRCKVKSLVLQYVPSLCSCKADLHCCHHPSCCPTYSGHSCQGPWNFRSLENGERKAESPHYSGAGARVWYHCARITSTQPRDHGQE